MFFAISIMWQEGLARSAPITGPDAVASAFSHSAQLALLTNVAIVVLALILVLALPRQIPSRKP